MDYRLKYIQSLIKKINISETVDFSAMGMNQPSIESPESEKNKREKELSLYERIKKAAPKGWTAKILPPGKGEVDTDSINPDILFIRKKDQKTVKIEAKVLNKSKSKTIQVGCTPTMSHGCAGIPSLRDIESRMREQEKILPNDPFPPRTVRLKTPRKDEAAIEHWRGTASEVFAKNDLHFVESDDDLHIFWPKDEDPPEHIADFLKDSKFAEYEIEATEFMSKKEITPTLFSHGSISINGTKYYYLISEKYDGELYELTSKKLYKQK
jgi:hypothetical protein